MICPLCTDNGEEREMVLEDWTQDYHDPGDFYGHGQLAGKVWVCGKCGHEEEYEPDSDKEEDAED